MINSTYSAELKSSQRLFNTPGLLFTDIYEKKLPLLHQLISYQSITFQQKSKQPIPLPENKSSILKELAKDITKPIWPCQMTFTPNFAYSKYLQKQIIPNHQNFNELMEKFSFRYKNEHQDQSTLRINTEQLNEVKSDRFQKETRTGGRQLTNTIQKDSEQLFNKLYQITQKKIAYFQQVSTGDIDDVKLSDYQNQYKFLSFAEAVLKNFTDKDNYQKSEWQELKKFIVNFDYFLCRTQDSETTSTLFTQQPMIKQLSLIIHPILVVINHNLRTQIQFDQQKKLKKNQKQINKPQQGMQEQKQDGDIIFPDIRSPCSKLVFINLDGYQSEYSIQIAKYFSKYLMYISFPKQAISHQESDMTDFQKTYSSRFLNKYFMQYIQQKQKQLNQKFYKSDYKQLNKNLFVFPIHSVALKQKNPVLTNIGLYQSNFIYYLFKEVLFNQIREFNPAVIIVSYSGKIFIENKHFIEIIKELTILSNYKLMFFPNMMKTYMFEEEPIQSIQPQDQIKTFHKYYYQHNQMNIWHTDEGRPNSDLLEKLSVFLKVSSGTYNLSQIYEQQSYVQKFKNSKILFYAAHLIDLLSQEYVTIDRIRFRSNELISISKVIENSFNSQKNFQNLFTKTVPEFYIALEAKMRQLIKSINNEQGDQIIQEKYTKILNVIKEKYDLIEIDGILKQFLFQFKLEIATQKYYSNNYLIIKKSTKKKGKQNQQKKNTENIYSVQFQIAEGTKRQTLLINSTTKVAYEKYNRGFNYNLVYVLNYLNKTGFQNYYGKLEEKNISQNNKIKLEKISLELDKEKFQVFSDWNYHETKNFIYLYWPQKFDYLSYILCKLACKPYIPEIFNYVFRASRNQPDRFFRLEFVQNPEIIPRFGCTAYTIEHIDIQHMFIFGGCYHNQNNYLKFQNQLTKFTIKTNQYSLDMKNIPKSRKIQAVRPKFYYEIKPQQMPTDKNQKSNNPNGVSSQQIHLIGGYGKNFSRPYSIITTTFYHIQFKINTAKQQAEIERLYRLTTNPIQINIPVPIKVRGVTEMNILKSGQGKQFYIQPGVVNTDGYCFHHNDYNYNKQKDKENDKDRQGNYQTVTQFEFGEIQRQIYKQEINDLKKPSEETITSDIQAKYYRGNKSYYNFITIINETKPYVFELQFEIPHDVKQKHQTLPDIIHLTGESIISLDIYQTFIFALIKHPVYTLNKCILTEFDMSVLNGSNVQDTVQIVKLHEISRIKQDVSKHIMIAVNLKIIAILHGPQENPKKGENLIPELILKRNRNITQASIKQGIYDKYSTDLSNYSMKRKSLLSSSLFMKQDAIIHCFSFRTASRNEPKLYYNHSTLNLSEKQYKWTNVIEKVNLAFSIENSQQNPKNIQLFEMKKLENNKYQLKFIIDNNEYRTQFDEDASNSLSFKVVEAKSKFKQMNKQSIVLDKRHIYNTEKTFNESEKYSEIENE